MPTAQRCEHSKTLHRYLIDLLIATYPSIREKEFSKAVKKFTSNEFGSGICDIKIVPDAFAIYQEIQEIDIFEIEVTHSLPINKLEEYGQRMIEFECYGYQMNLFIVNKHGHINQVCPDELFVHYCNLLRGYHDSKMDSIKSVG